MIGTVIKMYLQELHALTIQYIWIKAQIPNPKAAFKPDS